VLEEHKNKKKENKLVIISRIQEKFNFFRKFFLENKEAIADGLNMLDVINDFSAEILPSELDHKNGLYKFQRENRSVIIRYGENYETVPSTGEGFSVVVDFTVNGEENNEFITRLVIYRYGCHRIVNYADIKKMDCYNNAELCTIEKCLDKMIKKFNEIKYSSNFKSVNDELKKTLEQIKKELL
jgi:hypothetical protein